MGECLIAHMLSADDLESVLVNISKRLDELGWPKLQVPGLNSELFLRDIELTRSCDS